MQKPDAPFRGRGLASAATPRKRTDKHSKICTAQGIRDRRIRLSLQVARKFFDLQDLLGYNTASKTIEWLFTNSQKAIKELAMDSAAAAAGGGRDINLVSLSDGRSEPFMSKDCEVMSGIEGNGSNNEMKEGVTAAEVDRSFEKKPKAKKATNLKESREKARAMARCRTEEKMMGKRVEDPSPTTNLEQLGSSSSTAAAAAADYAPLPSYVGINEKLLEIPYKPSTSLMGNWDFLTTNYLEQLGSSSSTAAADYAPPPSDVGTIEKLLGIPCEPSTSFMGNWNFLSNDGIIAAGTNPNSIFPATASPYFPLFH